MRIGVFILRRVNCARHLIKALKEIAPNGIILMQEHAEQTIENTCVTHQFYSLAAVEDVADDDDGGGGNQLGACLDG